MKGNAPHHWTICLFGARASCVEPFVGRLDEALAAADELESSVSFTVLRFEVIRGARAR